MTFVNPDMAALIHTFIAADTTLGAIDGLSIILSVGEVELEKSTTPGNQLVVVCQKRTRPASSTAGGLMDHQNVFVSVETTALAHKRTLQGEDVTNDARALVKTIVDRIVEIMHPKTWNGTGWLSHRIASNRHLGNPTETMAAHELIYECAITRGTI